MNKKSALFYGIGAFILVAIIVIVVSVSGNSKSAGQPSQTTGSSETASANVPAASVPTTPTLVGTWVSATAGKGMEGNGKLVGARSNTTFTTSGDVTIVIQTVDNGMASGTLAYSHLCTTAVITITGKSPVTRTPECISTEGRPIQVQVSGNALSFTGKADTGADIAFKGTFANDAVSGTFSRSSSYGDITGTFNLVRSK